MELTSSDSMSVFVSLRERSKMPATEMLIVSRADANQWSAQMVQALRAHWPEYLMEATELGVFMLSACTFAVLLSHPASPVAQVITTEPLRRLLMGTAMGLTAIAIIFSPLGKRSGAHFNPAVTLTFLRLGKVEPWDAVFYTLFQFIGAIVGVLVAYLLLGSLVADQSVKFVATVPGRTGPLPAFLAELAITFILMSVILTVSNNKRLSRWTGIFAGALVATYISIESPISGMSMNPARSFGSAVVGSIWTSLWIYFTAPPIGMLLAAEAYKRLKENHSVACAKLHHQNNKRCIFRCNFVNPNNQFD
jgi:aquaporin Z